jgi:hypothetical protein
MMLNLECERIGPRSWLVAGLLLLSTLLASCAPSLAAKGLLPDVQARRPPDLNLGPELILLDEPTRLATSLIDRDGHAHIFLADGKKQLRHVEVLGDTVVKSEILAITDAGKETIIDAVEQPAGKLRVLIGGKQYVRPAPNQPWQEIKGNRCQRFLPIKEDLFCAFVIKGEDVNAPKRTDYYGGFFLISPFFFWKTNQAAKLVIAQEEAPATSVDSWTIRGVVDPESALDAESDFIVETDNQGTVHILYYATRGGGFFFVGCGGFSCAGGSTGEGHTLHYAKVARDQLVPQAPENQNQASSPANAPTSWRSVQGALLPPIPPSMREDLKRIPDLRIRPLQRLFTLNKASGDIGGLLGSQVTVNDVGNTRRFEPGPCGVLSNNCGRLLVEFGIHDGTWLSAVDVVAAPDLPETDLWIADALAKSDTNGNVHVLLERIKPGFWVATRFITYLTKSGGNWSAPLTLGRLSTSFSSSYWDSRELVVSDFSSAFATWVNEEDKFVGRWIRPIQKAQP